MRASVALRLEWGAGPSGESRGYLCKNWVSTARGFRLPSTYDAKRDRRRPGTMFLRSTNFYREVGVCLQG